ncbi:hypothetical protein ABT369_11070 [Dactylosporangium sp. NPDC000244]|uniref:hypothetical protein n=1 Tax=Dactylosporangium sp. NPDC000244 TaxID=3154365 RepID=UPI003319D8D2
MTGPEVVAWRGWTPTPTPPPPRPGRSRAVLVVLGVVVLAVLGSLALRGRHRRGDPPA